ncbi:MAG: helix-turn-helix domain-containing protein [Weeksellaceae bacterium]
MDKEKKDLLKEFSYYFETFHNIPPLTSKIYAYLLLDCQRKGTTFEELVEIFHASKSSISNGLNYLTQLRYVEYYTKIDDRKRLYRVTADNLILRLQNVYEMLELEKRFSEKMKSYKMKSIMDTNDPSILGSDIYIHHLENSLGLISETVKKLKELSN